MSWYTSLNIAVKVLLCISIPFLLKHLPHRFKIPPSLVTLPFNLEWESPPLSTQENEKICAILKSPFTYLSHGNQSYVFESEDGEYVLKLFRYRLIRSPLAQAVKNKVDALLYKKAKDSFSEKVNKTFKAARLAFVEARSYTQVVFCHLNITEGLLPVTHFKTAFRSFALPMDRYRFVIQRKVVPFKEAMLLCKDDPQKMISQIDSLFLLLLSRSALGIRNSDPTLAPNFGFYQGRAVEMDFGNYRKIPLDPNRQWAEIDSFLIRLKDWLTKNAPEYAAVIDEKRLLAKTSFSKTNSLD